MHRFRFDPAAVTDDNVVVLSKEESRHALKVLRLKPGDVVELLDGKDKKFRGIIVSTDGPLVTASIDRTAAPKISTSGKTDITLAAAVIKPERMDLLIQKACELGATRIVPVLAARSVVKLSRERWTGKVERWKKIAVEACKQCGRARVPEIAAPVEFAAFVKSVKPSDLFLFPTLAVPGKTLKQALSQRPASVVVAIGPEGDFTPEETRLALERGAAAVTLGEAVLRSETAALYLLSVICFHLSE